jgi:hypothetical protein
MTDIQHGHARRGRKTKTYHAWRNMMARCTNSNFPQAADYIGRGITVCDRWKLFENFLVDMGECPSDLMLDRIDNDSGYMPNNCRWTTRKVSNQNRRRKGPQKLEPVHVVAIRVDPRTCRKIASQYGISPQQVERIKNRKQWAHV